ncbi:MAG: tyrosine-type recombinase/integrase [Desulfovibrionales bacterium]
MATVTIQTRLNQKGAESYCIYYKDPVTGKRTYYKTLRDKKAVIKEEAILRELIDTGEILQKKKPRRFSPKRFDEVCAELETIWEERQDLGELSPNTVVSYKDRLGVVKAKFGDRFLFDISEKEIKDYRVDVKQKNSPVTSNRNLHIIKQVFNKAQADGVIKLNPAAEIKYLSEESQERKVYLTPSELDILLEVAKALPRPKYMHVVILMAVEHGSSTQEILSLRWSDIDFDFLGDGTIRFYRTKNKRERTHFLMPRTKAALEQWKEDQEFMRRRKRIVPTTDLVVCRHNGAPIESFRKAWKKVKEIVAQMAKNNPTAANLLEKIKDYHFHDNRHTCASNLYISGADLKDVRDHIGHKDIKMTERYTHLEGLSERARSNQDRLNALYAQGKGLGNI